MLFEMRGENRGCAHAPLFQPGRAAVGHEPFEAMRPVQQAALVPGFDEDFVGADTEHKGFDGMLGTECGRPSVRRPRIQLT